MQYTNLSDTPIFISCNDGTMISIQEATERPVLIMASGPSNSIIGDSALIHPQEGEILSNQSEAMIIVDIGGSTSDAGMVLSTAIQDKAQLTVRSRMCVSTFRC
jgi:N-methylhydantoinase A/oxoprolinase/acetone carboxylase beta subunit